MNRRCSPTIDPRSRGGTNRSCSSCVHPRSPCSANRRRSSCVCPSSPSSCDPRRPAALCLWRFQSCSCLPFGTLFLKRLYYRGNSQRQRARPQQLRHELLPVRLGGRLFARVDGSGVCEPRVDASPAGLAMCGFCHFRHQSVNGHGKPHAERQPPVRAPARRTAGLRRRAETDGPLQENE